MKGFTSRMPRAEYDAIAAMNISRLKEIKRSPLHYRYALEHPRQTPALTLGIATHVATLEPERFEHEFAVWDRRSGTKMAARAGKEWEEFKMANDGKTLLTLDEASHARQIALAVRSHSQAMVYLSAGEPEVTMQWEFNGRACKGRYDWATSFEGLPCVVGLKTARNCQHYQFGSQAARVGYHLQWAWYYDAYLALISIGPRMVEIVVESEPPYAVAVYRIPNDILEQGRAEYEQLLETLQRCEERDEWPGPCATEEDLTLPSWVYQREEDIADLGLEAIA